MSHPTVLVIPGPWTSLDELSEALGPVVDDERAGVLWLHPGLGANITWHGPHPLAAKRFAAGAPGMEPATVDAIERHGGLAVVGLSIRTDSFDHALADGAMLLASGAEAVRAGGLAVKVENTGRVHLAKTWTRLGAAAGMASAGLDRGGDAQRGAVERLYSVLAQALVHGVLDEGAMITCGFHLLGTPEVRAAQVGEPSEVWMRALAFHHAAMFGAAAELPMWDSGDGHLWPVGYGADSRNQGPWFSEAGVWSLG